MPIKLPHPTTTNFLWCLVAVVVSLVALWLGGSDKMHKVNRVKTGLIFMIGTWVIVFILFVTGMIVFQD